MDFTPELFPTSLQRVLSSPEILDQLSHAIQETTDSGQDPMATSPVFQRHIESVVSPPLRDPEASGPSVSSHHVEPNLSLTEGHMDSHMSSQPSEYMGKASSETIQTTRRLEKSGGQEYNGGTKTKPFLPNPSGLRGRQPFRAPALVYYPNRGRQSQRYNPSQRNTKYYPRPQNRNPNNLRATHASQPSSHRENWALPSQLEADYWGEVDTRGGFRDATTVYIPASTSPNSENEQYNTYLQEPGGTDRHRDQGAYSQGCDKDRDRGGKYSSVQSSRFPREE